ncbi:hypothetical protein C2869_01580 [Saccharobesus litoralis]|uniref:Carrier domain-containing protein n=1 Tax=Saccharobesus litoralis TaxID=2172099 RepID=A0A2S0VLX9_9ALTE|nr:amino acid adenylation domain-containing protein [Saccharobesus litoralis]AWB65213.1 hypothetical protein C2869_01580 [Saccharobesus litoralis]
MVSGSEEYFCQKETTALGQHIQRLLTQMCKQPSLPYTKLNLINPEDLALPNQDDLKPNETIISSFLQQVENVPNNPAIIWQQDQKINQLSYLALNQQADQVALALQQHNIQPADIIAVKLPRTAQTLVAYIAILKMGAVLMPMDPDLPASRTHQQLTNSRAKLIFLETTASEQNDNQEPNVQDINQAQTQQKPIITITFSQLLAWCQETHQTSSINTLPRQQDLAYVMYTSGSTGLPKGICVSHQALISRINWLKSTLEYSAQDTWLQSIQLSFDPALIEVFLPLCSGAKVALAGPGKIAPNELAKLVHDFTATSIIFVPTTLNYFNQAATEFANLPLRVAISGGEVLQQTQVDQFHKLTNAKLFNLYGPTEACIFATSYLTQANAPYKAVPIGKPVANTSIYILDVHGMPLPNGCIGEIAIAGIGLANGYINDEINTDARFVKAQFNPSTILYLSGDKGFINEQGNLEYVARIDQQIKLRGQRIEPKEIALTLVKHSLVTTAAVKLIDNTLHAWVVSPNTLSQQQINLVKQALHQALPAYMVPQFIHQLSSIPKQTSGKINYAQLTPVTKPTTNCTAPLAPLPAHSLPNHSLPNNKTQVILLKLVRQILSNNNINENDHLFDAGADSLACLQLISEIKTHTGKNISFSILLEHPTVVSLASVLETLQPPTCINLTFNPQGKTLFIAASSHNDVLRLTNLAKALGAEYSVYVLQPPLTMEPNNPSSALTVESIAKHYASVISQYNFTQPITLAGFSVGGVYALETCRHLLNSKIVVEHLFLIDTTYPVLPNMSVLICKLFNKFAQLVRRFQQPIIPVYMRNLVNDPGLRTQIIGLKSYRPLPINLSTTLIQSKQLLWFHRLTLSFWVKLCAQKLSTSLVAGKHNTLFLPTQVKGVAQAIKQAITKANKPMSQTI